MDIVQGGATIWARQTIESDIFFWKPDKWFKIWFYIVNRVNFEDTKLFKRGSAYIEYKEIELKTHASYSQIQKFIKWAKGAKCIATHKSTRGNIITVLNYDRYQNFNTYKSQARSQALGVAEAKQKPSTSHAIVKNDNNGNNGNNKTINDFFDYYLLKTKCKFKLTADKKLLISKRLSDGYTLEQLKTAVDNFILDDWEGRSKHLDIIYCIGKQKGKPDALEKWINIVKDKKKEFIQI